MRKCIYVFYNRVGRFPAGLCALWGVTYGNGGEQRRVGASDGRIFIAVASTDRPTPVGLGVDRPVGRPLCDPCPPPSDSRHELRAAGLIWQR